MDSCTTYVSLYTKKKSDVMVGVVVPMATALLAFGAVVVGWWNL